MPDDVESRIRTACAAADYNLAAHTVVQCYGPEILGFLVAWMNDRETAGDAFSSFTEDLCRGLPSFDFRCSARGWAYTLARNAGRREAKRRARHRGRFSLLDRDPSARPSRTHTAAYLRTSVKERIRLLRERLPPDDQSLLILRMHRELSFRELAIVFGGEAELASEEALEREATRLRKRFQLTVERLRRWASEEGLLEPRA